MKGKKLNFDELSSKIEQLSNEDQLKMVGGRRGRGGTSSWGGTRGGFIDDDFVIRLNVGIVKGK